VIYDDWESWRRSQIFNLEQNFKILVIAHDNYDYAGNSAYDKTFWLIHFKNRLERLISYQYITSERVSDYCLSPKWTHCQLHCISWREQVKFDEIIMMYFLNYDNALSWVFTVLAYWKNSPRARHVAQHIILIPCQSVFYSFLFILLD
jgi:hypothetical protein